MLSYHKQIWENRGFAWLRQEARQFCDYFDISISQSVEHVRSLVCVRNTFFIPKKTHFSFKHKLFMFLNQLKIPGIA
jgi:hypothetical protein